MSRTLQELADAGLEWSDDAVLATPQITSIPEAPGLLVLVRGATSEAGRVVWAEAPENLRVRARELGGHATVGPELAAVLQYPDLRFRYALVHVTVARTRFLERLRASMAATTETG
jgi:hypothetical protein